MNTGQTVDIARHLKEGSKIVIDPDTEGSMVVLPQGMSEQQLQAAADCEYIIIDPILNVQWRNGSWEAIPVGQIQENQGVMMLRAI